MSEHVVGFLQGRLDDVAITNFTKAVQQNLVVRSESVRDAMVHAGLIN